MVMGLMKSAAVRNGTRREPNRPSSDLPELDAAQNPGGVVDDRDAL
jgi:hypothetical protein